MRLLQISFLLVIIMGFINNDSQKVSSAYKSLKATISKDSTIHYLALGDSYSAGTSVRSGKSFPWQLKTCLKKKLQREVSLEVMAKAGWRTDELLNVLKLGTQRNSYDVVTLLIGVNNHYQKTAFNRYKNDFPKLVEQAIELVEGNADQVFIVSIPDWSYTPFGEKDGRKNISKGIDKYNAFAKKIAEDYKTSFITITDISREGLKDTNYVAKDGLHPSGMAYKRFVERICPSVFKVLNK